PAGPAARVDGERKNGATIATAAIAPANAAAIQRTRRLMALPIAHAGFVNLSLQHDRSIRKYGGVERNSAKPDFPAARGVVEAFEQPAVPVEHFRTAARNAWCDVVRLHETIERALELVGRKRDVESNFTLHAFQGVCLLRRTARACRPGYSMGKRSPPTCAPNSSRVRVRCATPGFIPNSPSFSSAKTNRVWRTCAI